MKKYLVLLAFLPAHFIFSQFHVRINGREIKPGDELLYSELNSFQLSFEKARKLPTYSDGSVWLTCMILDSNGKSLGKVSAEASGYAGINTFLYPESPKNYVLMPGKTIREADMKDYNDQFADLCEKLKYEPKAEKVTVEISLDFYERNIASNGETYYEKAIPMVDKFVFKLSIADRNAWLKIPNVGASFRLNDLLPINYHYFRPNEKWNNVGDVTSSGLNEPGTAYFDFHDFHFNLTKLNFKNGRDIQTNLAAFKDSCNKAAEFVSNQCNHPKVIWSQEALTKKRVEKAAFLAYGYQRLAGFENEIIERFNSKKNKNVEKESLWEPFTLGGISGYKAVNMLLSGYCEGASVVSGASAVFVFAHPTDSNALVVLTWSQVAGRINEELPAAMTQKMELFLKNLKFD